MDKAVTEEIERGDDIAAPRDATPTEAVGDALMRADLKSRMFGVAAPVKVGRFDVLGKVGEGGMGVVYAARDCELDRPIALKLLHGGEPGSPGLAREAKALAQLSHPNVVAIHDIGRVNGRTYIAMELLEGDTLRHWVEAGQPWDAIVHAFAQAGEGLLAAHEVGIVHRDFKPDNAIRGEDGRVRVLDFGLARAAGAPQMGSRGESPKPPPGLTATGHVHGTPAYMAPEQAAQGRVDARCDQYSWCVALYEALAGHRPFRGESLAELAHAIATGQIEPPPECTPTPAAVWAVLLRGLSINPEDRFATMRGPLDALARVSSAQPTGAGRSPLRVVDLGLGAVAVLGVGMLGYAGLSHDDAPADPTVAGEVDVSSPPEPNQKPATEASSLAPPEECPRFRTPGLDPAVRSGRLAYLSRAVALLDDGDRRLPETLLWISELSLQADDQTMACGSLDRLAKLTLTGEVADAAACWRRVFCHPVEVACPPGFVVDSIRGCHPAQACEVDLDDDTAVDEVKLACDHGDPICCPMANKLASVAYARASRGQDEALQRATAADVLETSVIACDQGNAGLCAHAAELLSDDDPLPPDDRERAGPLRAKACKWGHRASCG